MKSVVFFDIETERGFGGGIIYGYYVRTDKDYNFIEEGEFYDGKEFVEYMKKHKGYYIAHNGGRFDFVKLFPYLAPYYSNKKAIFRHGRIIRAELTKEMEGVVLVDSFAIIPMGLKKFKKAFNLNIGKQELPFVKYIIPEYLTKDEVEALKEYTKYDVYTLWQGFKKFEELLRKKFGLSKHIYEYASMSSISFAITRQKLKQKGIQLPKITRYRNFYSGGRTEVFKFEGEKLYYMDINSAYPYVMWKHEFPIGKLQKHKDIDVEGFTWLKILYAPEYYIPPVFAKTMDKLFFPQLQEKWLIGLTTYEARELEKLGYEFEILAVMGTEEKARIFEFMHDMYIERKLTKDKGLRTVIKLYMNASYGKFGQKDIVEMLTPYGTIKIHKNIFSNTAIASYITAYARMYLWYSMKKVGLENVYYCDTDSMITKRYDEDLLGDDLGKWKLEYRIERYYALQPKVYFIETKDEVVNKAKGFGFIEANSVEEFKHQLMQAGILKEKTASLKHILRWEQGESYDETRTLKMLKTPYEKRKVLGIDTIAWKLEEIFNKKALNFYPESYERVVVSGFG